MCLNNDDNNSYIFETYNFPCVKIYAKNKSSRPEIFFKIAPDVL